MSISIGDFKNIGELSGILVVPLISAACYTQFGWWAIRWDDSIIALMNSEIFIVSVVAQIFAFVLSIFITTVVDYVFSAVSAPYKAFRFIMLLSLMTYGILGLGSSMADLVSAREGVVTLKDNLYFNLAALAWGFDIFNSEPNANKQSQQESA